MKPLLLCLLAGLFVAGCGCHAVKPVPIGNLTPKQKAALVSYIEAIDTYNEAMKP